MRSWRKELTKCIAAALVLSACGGNPNVTILTSASGRIRMEIDPDVKGYQGNPNAYEDSFKELGFSPPELRIRVVGPNARMPSRAPATTCWASPMDSLGTPKNIACGEWQGIVIKPSGFGPDTEYNWPVYAAEAHEAGHVLCEMQSGLDQGGGFDCRHDDTLRQAGFYVFCYNLAATPEEKSSCLMLSMR